MEALRIDVFRLIKDVSWKIHPILRDTNPKDVHIPISDIAPYWGTGFLIIY
jgi:hypothetical protein